VKYLAAWWAIELATLPASYISVTRWPLKMNRAAALALLAVVVRRRRRRRKKRTISSFILSSACTLTTLSLYSLLLTFHRQGASLYNSINLPVRSLDHSPSCDIIQSTERQACVLMVTGAFFTHNLSRQKSQWHLPSQPLLSRSLSRVSRTKIEQRVIGHWSRHDGLDYLSPAQKSQFFSRQSLRVS